MTSEHEKLAKQLFVTCDITGLKVGEEKDFRIVKLRRITNDLIRETWQHDEESVIRDRNLFASSARDLEDAFPPFLARLVNLECLYQKELGPEGVKFQVEGKTLVCSGPIGYRVIDGDKHEMVALDALYVVQA